MDTDRLARWSRRRSNGVRSSGLALAAIALAGCASAAGRAAKPEPAPATAPQQAGDAVVFDGVTVVDVEQGKLLPNQRVVVAGDSVRAVEPKGKPERPAGSR